MMLNSRLVFTTICFLISNAAWAGNNKSSSPVKFIQNKGQWENEILFKGTSTTPVAFLIDGISFAQSGEEYTNTDGFEEHPFVVWNMKFLNHSKGTNLRGLNGSKSVYSYLSGNDPANWIVHPDEFSMLKYESVFNNIDLFFYGTGNSLKYDFVVQKGGNIQSIQAYYEGVENLVLNKNRELEVTNLYGIQVQRKPVAWQNINGVKKSVAVNYILLSDSTFGFEAPYGFNADYELIIDPLFEMVWSSYTMIPGGSNNINYCFSNAMDADGNVYLTGMVDNSFPITPGAYSGPDNVQPEIFVAKFSSDGTTLIYWTYLPGNSSEFGTSIEVDEFGRAYVTGVINLNITGLTTFPSTANAYQPVHNTGSDAFLTVLNPAGSGLDYSTFLGGTGSETGYDVALGGQGIAYITGYTSIGNFPVKASSAFPTGDNDLFVAKFDINQAGANSLIYSTRIGGGSFTLVHGRSIAVNSAGNVFITGTISSSFGTPTYPTTPGAYNSVFNTGQDGVMCFATKLSATTPVSLDYSTFIAPGTGNGIALHAITDEVVIAGTTYTFAFTVTAGALQPVHAGLNGTDAFAVKLNATGSALVYSTFIGGNNYDNGTSVAVNSTGEAYITGIAQDLFPTSAGAFQPNNAGTYDFFLVNLNNSGTGYGCGGSTYIGGSDADYSGSFYDYPAPHVSIRDHGGYNDTVCVSATSHSQNFPTTPGAYGTVKVNGISDQPVFFKMTCIPAGAVPSVSFSSSDSTWCDKKAIDFFDMSTNNPTSWQWYFPGAVPDTSTLQNPTGIYYASSGTFPVTLVACNASGCDSVTYTAFIYELPTPQPPTLTINGNTICASGYLAYQWFEISNPSIVLSTDSCFTPANAGNYFVIATDTNGCESASASVAITTEVIELIKENMIAINPNPFSSSVIVELNLTDTKNVLLSISDATGRRLKTIVTKNLSKGNNKITIDLTELNHGIYFCHITSDIILQTIKLVKN